MLKKFKLGTMGMTTMVILMFIAATFNFSTVNAAASDLKSTDKKTTELKWVKKHVNGMGDVTAREDMFVGEGDNIKVMVNKDFKEIGIITPLVENAPETDVVTIDTPYGQVVTSRDYYDRVGKDQIIAEQKAFKEEREQLIKNGIIKNSTDATDNIFDVPLTLTSYINKPKVLSSYISTTAGDNSVREDWRFLPKSGMTPNGVVGTITPAVTSPLPPSSVTSYQEMEILLNPNYPIDAVEFISQHYATGKSVWALTVIDGVYTTWHSLTFDPANYPIEYYFKSNPTTNTYDLRLYNTGTGVTHRESVPVTNREPYIYWLDASTELIYPTPIPAFYARTTIRQDGVYMNTYTYNPTDVFDSTGRVGSSSYVDISNQQSGTKYITTHTSGNTVA